MAGDTALERASGDRIYPPRRTGNLVPRHDHDHFHGERTGQCGLRAVRRRRVRDRVPARSRRGHAWRTTSCSKRSAATTSSRSRSPRSAKPSTGRRRVPAEERRAAALPVAGARSIDSIEPRPRTTARSERRSAPSLTRSSSTKSYRRRERVRLASAAGASANSQPRPRVAAGHPEARSPRSADSPVE